MITVSPSLQRKQGEMCAEMLVWRFSYRCADRLGEATGFSQRDHLNNRGTAA